MRTAIAPGRVTSPDLDWVRLDDTVLYWGEDDGRWAAAHDDARSAGISLRERPALGDLQLVTQVGRVFQQEHPEVPVLLDKGRYLVVALEDQRIPSGTCYRLEPLTAGEVVFRTVRPAAGSPDPDIQQLVGQVSPDAYRDALAELVAFGTRHSLSTGFQNAAAMARDHLSALGYITTTMPISVGQGQSANVIAERLAASRLFRETVVVTAHLDSINLAGGPAAPAPGADDNGSGAAALLELARLLVTVPLQNDLVLILFGGEEEGLFGSTQYVRTLTGGQPIGAVVNMDMIGARNTPSPTVLLEGAQLSSHIINALAETAATYTSLNVQTSLHPFNSDHVPFIEAAIPAVLTIEGADGANDRVHTATDTLDTVDIDLAVEIIRMNLAFTATALTRP